MSETREFLIALEPVAGGSGNWHSNALDLPQARVKIVRDAAGNLLNFAPAEDGITVTGEPVGPLQAQIEIAYNLLSQDDLERQKLAYEERGRRSTFFWTIGSALLTAAVTLFVALLNRPGTPPIDQAKAPPTFADLDECRDSLERVTTLANQPDQTLDNLRKLIRSHDEACKDRLNAALASLRR